MGGELDRMGFVGGNLSKFNVVFMFILSHSSVNFGIESLEFLVMGHVSTASSSLNCRGSSSSK